MKITKKRNFTKSVVTSMEFDVEDYCTIVCMKQAVCKELNFVVIQEIRSVEDGICPIAEFISDSATSKGQIAFFFIAHARNGYISTSGQKSDVTIVFPEPDFLYDAGIVAIREHLRQILRFSYLHGISGSKMGILGRKLGKGGAMLTPNQLVLTFGGLRLCVQFVKTAWS